MVYLSLIRPSKTKNELNDLLQKLTKHLTEASAKPFTRRSGCPTYNFAVVIVQHKDGRLLSVKETRNRGIWLPAGFVDPGESFIEAAHRETLEEAGIKVQLEGILRVEHSVQGEYSARCRVIFYARPVDMECKLKSVPDEESEGAEWVTLEQLDAMRKKKQLRGHELLHWGTYLAQGGPIFPLSTLTMEADDVVVPPSATVTPVFQKKK